MAIKPGDPLDKQIPNYFNPQGLATPPPPPPWVRDSPLWPGDLPKPADPQLTHNEVENIRQEIVQAQRKDPTTGGLHNYTQPERLRGDSYYDTKAAQEVDRSSDRINPYRKGGPVIHPSAKGLGLQPATNFARGGAVLNHVARSPYMKGI